MVVIIMAFNKRVHAFSLAALAANLDNRITQDYNHTQVSILLASRGISCSNTDPTLKLSPNFADLCPKN